MGGHQPIRTAIYVDGFNLYYWLKPSPYRWLDIQKLVMSVVTTPDRQYEVVAVKYFTARVSGTEGDPGKATRQDFYLRALAAVTPTLKVYQGEFRRQPKYMPRYLPNGEAGPTVLVWDTEEKGSDVNLSVELVNDAWCKLYDLAIVVSNDSDLERAVRISKKKGRTIGVLIRGDASVNSLGRFASFSKKLTFAQVEAALLPREIPGTSVRIPEEWRKKEDIANLKGR
jgi:uncharacterized LabA/DUF88 family protein